MTKTEIEQIKKTKTWKFTIWDYLRILYVIFPAGILLIGLFMLYSGIKNDVMGLLIMSFIIVSIGVALTVLVTIRIIYTLKFLDIELPKISVEQIERVLNRLQFENVKFHRDGYFQITTRASWFSWGEEITLIPDNNKILINSRPTGNGFIFQPITINRDSNNIKGIIEELKNTATNSIRS